DAQVTRPAALAFAGDTYQGLDAATLNAEDMDWAQDHLRILSGLYGLLRPCDAIQPYRLEMGSRLKNQRGGNLYDYWGDDLSNGLNALGDTVGADILVNCASQEYFGAVPTKALRLRVVNPAFMEDKNDGKGPRIISFFAKKARGAMARHIIQNRLTNADDVQGFDVDGYVYRDDLSGSEKPVFVRDHPAA
ncbi:peroxide stress protein YaaA, partial [Roseobacter sp.]